MCVQTSNKNKFSVTKNRRMQFTTKLGFDLKKVDTAADVPMHQISDDEGVPHMTISLLTDADNYEMFHVKVRTVSQRTAELYEKVHRPFCKKRAHDKKKFILCYDLRECDVPFDLDLLKQLAVIKQSLMSEYTTSLICTIVIVESEAIKTILNMLFTTMYTPVRPVRLVKTVDDASDFLSNEKQGGHNASIYSQEA